MTRFKVKMLLKGKPFEIIIGSQSASSAFSTAKELFSKALVIKAEKA